MRSDSLCRLGSPEDIASAILFLADAKADFITDRFSAPRRVSYLMLCCCALFRIRTKNIMLNGRGSITMDRIGYCIEEETGLLIRWKSLIPQNIILKTKWIEDERLIGIASGDVHIKNISADEAKNNSSSYLKVIKMSKNPDD